MLCGMAQSVTQIILFRVLQGAFGAALVPLSQTVLLGAYPRERQGFAMAFFGMGVLVGPVLGPVLGGWLTRCSRPICRSSWAIRWSLPAWSWGRAAWAPWRPC